MQWQQQEGCSSCARRRPIISRTSGSVKRHTQYLRHITVPKRHRKDTLHGPEGTLSSERSRAPHFSPRGPPTKILRNQSAVESIVSNLGSQGWLGNSIYVANCFGLTRTPKTTSHFGYDAKRKRMVELVQSH